MSLRFLFSALATRSSYSTFLRKITFTYGTDLDISYFYKTPKLTCVGLTSNMDT
jgi:hypothetical protein